MTHMNELTAEELQKGLKDGTLKVASGKSPGPQMNESKLQQTCVKWFRLQYPSQVLYSVPNGGHRSKISAAMMNAEGQMPGVPDLFLMAARGKYHGLYLEMKWKSKGLSAAQISFHVKAEKEGYKCVVCRTFDEFRDEVETYLKS